MMKKTAILLAMSVALTASPALAKNNNAGGNGGGNGGGKPAPAPAPTPTPTPAPIVGCSSTYGSVVTGATGCQGFYVGNIFNQSDVAIQGAAVAGLGGSFGGDFGSLTAGTLSGDTVDFGRTLYGQTIVGMHFGNIANPLRLNYGGQGNGNNVSVLWLFDFGTEGSSGIKLLDTRGWSNASLYSTGTLPAVPEPAAWALLIVGFGTVGMAMRARHAGRPAHA